MRLSDMLKSMLVAQPVGCMEMKDQHMGNH
jgi:hypothetical protein